MPHPRIHSDRPQTGPERARRSRENLRAYVRALERAALYADTILPDPLRIYWDRDHHDTIARARAAQQQKED